ncbi:MAG: hypothetical protein LBV20_00415 [Treponema sp.]|jgi:hypothetical protein|nr:hypothetical protein [Treponema sp.]
MKKKSFVLLGLVICVSFFFISCDALMEIGSGTAPIEGVGDYASVITNGLYGEGTKEQNATVDNLLGGSQYAKERFELYFQWYNTVHELGHSISGYYGTQSSRHEVEEEQLVNSFAVAFWMQYGEPEKIQALEEVVTVGLSNVTPAVDNMTYLEYWKKVFDEDRFQEAFNLNDYGWFQYNIVNDVLSNRASLDLESILEQMGVKDVQLPNKTLRYPTLGKGVVSVVLSDVISLLRSSGVKTPDIYLSFSTDPNNHTSTANIPTSLVKILFPKAVLVPTY